MSTFTLFDNLVAADIVVDEKCPEGVQRIAQVLAKDIEMVTGTSPRVLITGSADFSESELSGSIIMVNARASERIEGKREVYELAVRQSASKDDAAFAGVKTILNVYGSDKRGLIYGLFAISELCGVSPLVWWGDAKPEKKERIVLNIGDGADTLVSKEPSVKYRGFFINDEWPAFGRWSAEKFGGFTADVYEQVFILLLRMRGNYMWPAMWSSTFSEDGPGLASAQLADKFGIIMGASHHEPMCRAGEEWQHIYKNYGDDNTWSFVSNKAAITDFWRDGVVRNRDFENIITIGMRGEQDSKLMGEDATLEDNINVIKDAILTQHKLIRENINSDLTKVPRMLAIYKEVEDYYYGAEGVPGLRDWEELRDVIFMLCEDNFGNMRGLPEANDLKTHRGGYGMYYHFDYHGAPVSYEWVNCSRLTKTREQMCMAYEYEVRDLWIVNVGDLKGNEYPLSYFMALAYDYDKWSKDDAVEEYVSQFIRKIFGETIDKHLEEELTAFIDGYTKWNSIRHPEAMNPSIFNPVNFDEAKFVYAQVEDIMTRGKALRESLTGNAREAFDSMFYYAGMASLNLILMHLEAGQNAYFAELGDVKANDYAKSVKNRIAMDEQYVKEFHELIDGKWNHMMDSAHTGFRTWCDEGWSYPEVREITGNEAAKDGAAPEDKSSPNTVFAGSEEIIAIEAENFSENNMVDNRGWRVIKHLGRLGNAIKAYPVNITFDDEECLPYVQYDIDALPAGEYNMEFVFMARNPVVKGGPLRVRYSVNDSAKCVLDTIGPNYFTEWPCGMWNRGVMTGIHTVTAGAEFVEGKNSIRVYPFDPNAVLERIVIYPANKKLPNSYLGAR